MKSHVRVWAWLKWNGGKNYWRWDSQGTEVLHEPQKLPGWWLHMGWKRNWGASQAILQMREVGKEMRRREDEPTAWLSLQKVGAVSDSQSDKKQSIQWPTSQCRGVWRGIIAADTHWQWYFYSTPIVLAQGPTGNSGRQEGRGKNTSADLWQSGFTDLGSNSERRLW